MKSMKLLRRHKFVLILLGIYWPFLFWLTHIPVPVIARQSGMSDKTMHVLAYFSLTFLVWFAVSPYEKVNWARAKVWYVILAVILYSAADEFLQSRVGRSADIRDFIANLIGVFTALGLLSILGFWSSLLLVSSVFIFVLSNVTCLMTLPQYMSYAAVFHFTSYAAFTLIWIQWQQRFARITPDSIRWLVVALAVPLILLLVVKAAAPFFHRPLDGWNIVIAAAGIVGVVTVSWGVFRISQKQTRL